MIVRFFDIQNGKAVPTEHCYTLKFLKEVLESNKISFSKIEDLDNFKNFLYKNESEYSKKIAQVKMLV